MDPFVRRLIQRLHHPNQPLSRNRHFHTFDTPEGRLALKTSRRLKSLQNDLIACAREGKQATVRRMKENGDVPRVELRIERTRGSRVALLHESEFELLCELPGLAEVLAQAGAGG
jgi:hypothetical protein